MTVTVTVRLRSDAGVIRSFLASSTGPVAQDLSRRALRVESRAKVLCPVDTGRLRASIRWRLVRRPSGLVAIIGTEVEYARWVHEGTRYRAGVPFLTRALDAAR